MPPISDFVGALAVAGIPFKEIEETGKNSLRRQGLEENVAGVQDYPKS
jgi:hypothetical protein